MMATGRYRTPSSDTMAQKHGIKKVQKKNDEVDESKVCQELIARDLI